MECALRCVRLGEEEEGAKQMFHSDDDKHALYPRSRYMQHSHLPCTQPKRECAVSERWMKATHRLIVTCSCVMPSLGIMALWGLAPPPQTHPLDEWLTV